MRPELKKEIKVNWKKMTGVFAILFVAVIGYTVITEIRDKVEERPEINTSALSLCSRITGTPSWANGYGEVFTEVNGYQDYMNEDSVDLLISQDIYFIYNPSCSWCVKQIELFGDEWDKYKESGFAVDCTQLNKTGG